VVCPFIEEKALFKICFGRCTSNNCFGRIRYLFEEVIFNLQEQQLF
jgi:hypothetical protein